jgi:hypothetical protein
MQVRVEQNWARNICILSNPFYGVSGGNKQEVCTWFLRKFLMGIFSYSLNLTLVKVWFCLWDMCAQSELKKGAWGGQVKDPTARVQHEASTSKIGKDQIFYFQQRGIDCTKAVSTLMGGFCREVFKELPLELAFEVNQLMWSKLAD